MQLLRWLVLIGVNAVPLWGVFRAGWSPATLLIVYWFENLASILFIAWRGVIHRRLSRKRGYFTDPAGTTPNNFLSDFVRTMLLFTVAHGYFVIMASYLFFGRRLVVTDILRGASGIVVFLALGFAADLHGIRNRPFAWIRRLTQLAKSRMLIVHLTIVIGGFAAALSGAGMALFGVFIALKVLFDLASQAPEREVAVPSPRDLVGDIAAPLERKMAHRAAKLIQDEEVVSC